MSVDLAIVRISLEFNEELILNLKELSSQYGFEVRYLCHGKIPLKYSNDENVIRSYIRLSASRSRNLLYRYVQSSRIIFLDEDASLSVEALSFLVHFIQTKDRCHVIFSGKKKIFKKKKVRMNDWNFYRINRFYCEWNTIYDKTLLKDGRLFPGIGVGSRHEFWSGEGTCSLLNIKSNATIYLRPESVLHPPLSDKKDFNTARKYIKGYGFAMSYIVRRGKMLLKIITFMRFMFSVVRDVFIPKRISPSAEVANVYIYGLYALVWKLQGFIGR